MSASFDFTELDAFIADLGSVPAQAHRNVRAAVQVTAHGIQQDWRGAAKGPSGRHARAYPNAIDYDIEEVGDGVIAEIGPNHGKRQGKLGFLEEGVEQTPGQQAMRLAVRANQDDFIRGLLKAVTDPLEG